MKPADLARILIDRFDSDSLIEPPPTRLQERIQAIFLIWLNSYWNDFHSRRTRKLITRFLNRIAKEQVLRPISDSLRPLIGRLPPVEDPDAHWGMVDDQDDDEDSDSDSDSDDDIFEECEPVPTTDDADQEEETPTTVTSKNKKDSGYSADSFSVFGFFGVGGGNNNNNETKDTQDSKSISEGCKLDEAAPPLKRTSSSSSFSLFGRSRKSSISSSFGFLFGLSPMTAAKPEQQPSPPEKKEKPVQQPPTTPEPTPVKKVINTPPPPSRPKSPALSISSSTHSLRRRPSVDVRSTTEGKNNDKRASRAEFAGGLINIDLHCGMSTSPSWTSFGANTVASSTTSYMSTFGNNNPPTQPRNEKEANNQIYKMMMDLPDSVVANQLTWIEAELFGKIKAREFIRNIWAPGQQSRPSSVSSEDQIKAGSAVVASIAHFNFISAWVATMIVTQAKVNKRAALLQKFMSIAVELRNHNNYNSLMAVLAGLNSAPVLRLKQTREAMTDKKIYKQFQSLERLMSSDRSFSSYRLALKASEPPGVPYLGIHNQDLISLAEGNKDFRADGTIHWDKFRLMGECIVAMMKFQCPAYDIEPDGRILRFIADFEILSEDEQYKRSNLVEPRLKSSSTNRLRDLWLRM
ncbi:ras GEF [Lichtheimia hyalospora FSU 10163]|nr:ras GEF [Lichtheimia hyalospora FSU 10163]